MKKTINKIECIIENPGNERVVVLIHGFGADCRDLAPLHEYLDPDGKYTWVFPNGPISVPLGMAMEGRAWFEIPMEELQREIASGIPRDYSNISPKGFTQAVSQMQGLIFELLQDHKEIIIGGFSQGGMMASHLLGACGESLKGAILYSTVLLDTVRIEKSISGMEKVPFIQSHGRQDPVLAISNGKKLFDILEKNKFKGEWVEFSGGHEIPMQVLQKSAHFLKNLK
ncbi:MAG: esterase [Bdellovibrionaceae bacterium]|nr:esterase [Pseudobdellovibrionaceae bacterium]